MYLIYLMSLCITHNIIVIMFWFLIHLTLEIIQAMGNIQGTTLESYFGLWNILDLGRLTL